jgi:uncharacterized RDD family membrane protein YckC
MDIVWYYAEGEKSVGPLSQADLSAILSRVTNAKSILVWRDGFATWVKAESVPELAPYVIKPPPLPITPRGVTGQIVSADLAAAVALHPWRRFFARMIDMYIFVLIFFLFLGIVFPELFATTQTPTTTRENDYLYSLFGTAAYTVYEAICLNVFGITFGKFLYGIQIKAKEDDGIAFSIALKRALAVWFRGLGLGIPFVTLITLFVAYRTLLKDRQTSWDRDFSCRIFHREFSVLRWFVIGITWFLLLSVYAILIEIGSR